MRAVIQRVKKAEVSVDGIITGKIDSGLLVLLGIGPEDEKKDLVYIADKIIGLRIFEDANEKMNLSVKDIEGKILAVSQFTLYGDCRKGKRPNFSGACEPKKAKIMYNDFVDYCNNQGVETKTGIFAADMSVSLVNDGPVTIILDSSKIL